MKDMFTWLELVLIAAVVVLGLAWLYQTGAKIHWKLRARAAEIAVRGAIEAVDQANRTIEARDRGHFAGDDHGGKWFRPRQSTEWPDVLEEKKD